MPFIEGLYKKRTHRFCCRQPPLFTAAGMSTSLSLSLSSAFVACAASLSYLEGWMDGGGGAGPVTTIAKRPGSLPVYSLYDSYARKCICIAWIKYPRWKKPVQLVFNYLFITFYWSSYKIVIATPHPTRFYLPPLAKLDKKIEAGLTSSTDRRPIVIFRST